jgi:metacaspase-1
MRRALFIGVDDYHPLIGPLGGCVNDAMQVSSLLIERFSFGVADCRNLFNSQATITTILSELNQLISDAKAGDVLVLFFSGHGTRLPNPEDPSGKDEAIVTYSPQWDLLLKDQFDASAIFLKENWDKQFIRDKQIKACLDLLPQGVNLTLIMDCCHSGDIMRDVRVYPRFLEPPVHIQNAIEEAQQAYWAQVYAELPPADLDEYKLSREQAKHLIRKVILGNRFDFIRTEESSILLAACSEKETALEKLFDGQRGGVFTHHLVKSLLDHKEMMTYRELISILGDKMRFTPQMPRLACPEDYRNLGVFSPMLPGG